MSSDHRDQAARRRQLLHEAEHRVARGHLPRVAQRPQHDVAREQRRQHQARQHAGNEQPGDRDFGRDAIDDHDDRRRDQQAQRAGAGQRAHDHGFGVATAREFGQRHLADGGAGGRAGARHRRKDGAAHHVGVQQPPGQRLHPGRQALEHVLAEPGAKQDLAHPHEQRQRGERPAAGRTPDGDGHGVARRARAEQLHADPRHARQREADPHAAAQNQEQRKNQQAGDGDVTHCAGPQPGWPSGAGRAAPAPVRPRTRWPGSPCPAPWPVAESTAAWRRWRWTHR